MQITQKRLINGTPTNRPYVLNCDWFSFSFSFNPKGEIVPPNGYKWVSYPGTNIFRKRYILYNSEGAKMLTICCDPYSPILKPDVGSAQIANPWLYRSETEFFRLALDGFKGGRFNGCSRLDIALDFHPTDSEFATIRKLTSGAYYVSGKSEGSLFWHTEKYNDKEYRMAHCLSWGSKSSMLNTKLYNKSLEIHADNPAYCTKPYIVDQWRGWLPDIRNVWRLEFSIMDVNQYVFGGEKYKMGDALDGNLLIHTYSTLKNKRFTIRKNQGRRHGHRNEDEIVDDFVWLDFGGLTIAKSDPSCTHAPLDDMRAMARQLHRHLTDTCVLMDDWRYVSMRDMLIDYAQNPAVLAYLDHISGCSFATWLGNVENMRMSGAMDAPLSREDA